MNSASTHPRAIALSLIGTLLLACDPPAPPAGTAAPTPPADTVEHVVPPPPPELSPADSLKLVQGMIDQMKNELEQARRDLAQAEKRRQELSGTKGGPSDQRARDMRDASIAVELNTDRVQRAEQHLKEAQAMEARLQAQVK